MKRDLFQLITSITIWLIIWLPIVLPNHVTGYIPSPSLPIMHEPWDTWAKIAVLVAMIMAFWKLDDWMGKVYDWLTKQH